ncbi:DUF2971 domain-containing protein [Shewanella electrodiphila]|uniref:DUF2971 domain-containing protein n=1 Tax=Shewanella electrodiphila TaxID=934143 RepID=A0ABT0KNY7_9GAMM|nr:DUF2971 domain-containing protein [Shewanella electrodiphila]MCL1045553.1 DUF2971 domain-containing protein [Shewanella electrodiphila]
MKQLFKYMNEPRSLFTEGFIRLSQPVVLNDPFEASFCSKSLDELASNFDQPMAQDPLYGNISFSKYIEMRMHNIGVISLSENKEHLLMWAHYANEHKGIVAGISYFPRMDSIFKNLFKETSAISFSLGEEFSPFDGIPKPVSYRKGLRYRNDKFDYDYSNISAEGADRILYEVFMQKSDEWIYEQEHRVVLRLEQADRVIIENIDQIESERIRDHIRSSEYLVEDPASQSCTINLYQIDEVAERLSVAVELAKLSINPNIIYLMRLNPSCINNCLLGLVSRFSKSDVQGAFACSVGYLDIWEANKNLDYYSLEFKQI